MSELSSFNLVLEPYCNYCPNFEAEIKKQDITSIGDKHEKTFTTIQCEHANKCRQVTERFSEMAKTRGK